MTSYLTTNLEFSAIKETLKTKLKQKSEFSDYDFEASGLSNILDVLAYNSHLNALLANFAVNEAFLSSAQLRASVVSIAQALGYTVRSRTASRAYLNLSLNLTAAATQPSSVTLPKGTKFTASVDGNTYTFQTVEAYTADGDAGIYTFRTLEGSEDIPVYEGTSRTKTFLVQGTPDAQVLVIPDTNVDTVLATVDVYETYTSTSFSSWSNLLDAVEIDGDSQLYRFIEAPNGFYEVHFGDGLTTGAIPGVGSKVVVQYLATTGEDANGASSFTPVSSVTVDGTGYPLLVSVQASSSGGAEKETSLSVKQNAPLSFAAQARLVTATDYENMVRSRYSAARDASAWGGEDNDPPEYGTVFVCIIFQDGTSASDKSAIQNEITSLVNENMGVLSVDVKFVDPTPTFLDLFVTFSFNPSLTGATRSTMENQVFSIMKKYQDDNLKVFDGTFRKSNLLALIDESSPAVLSSEASLTLQGRLTPVTAATSVTSSKAAGYVVTFPAVLASPDDVEYVVTSSSFYYGTSVCSVKNQLGSTKLRIVDTTGVVKLDNVGYYEPETGKVYLESFAPGMIVSGEAFIKVHARPLNDNAVSPLRNFYLELDEVTSSASAVIDRKGTKA